MPLIGIIALMVYDKLLKRLYPNKVDENRWKIKRLSRYWRHVFLSFEPNAPFPITIWLFDTPIVRVTPNDQVLVLVNGEDIAVRAGLLNFIFRWFKIGVKFSRRNNIPYVIYQGPVEYRVPFKDMFLAVPFNGRWTAIPDTKKRFWEQIKKIGLDFVPVTYR